MTTFTATVQLHGKTATGIEVPPSALEVLGGGKRPAVRVTLGGYTYRTTVGAMGGLFLLPLSAEHRQGAGLSAGDAVQVSLELDTEPRTVEVPADLAAALAPAARARFDALAYSHRQRHVLSVEGAKTPETRARRIAAVVAALG